MILHVDPKELPPILSNIIRKAFPSYNGRKFEIKTVTEVKFLDNYWSGGTKSNYMGANLETGQVFSPGKQEYGNPFSNPQVPTVDIPEGCCIVEHHYFCGKDMGITIYLNPENATKLIENKSEELSEQEKGALILLRSTKGGHYRQEEWERIPSFHVNIKLPGKYGADNPVIKSLAEKKLVKISANGAISVTTKGKNCATSLVGY